MKIDWKRIGIAELAALVSEQLRQEGIDSLVVGGACVSIYTHNEYQSGDIDIVSHVELKRIDSALASLGFARKRYARHFSACCRRLLSGAIIRPEIKSFRRYPIWAPNFLKTLSL